MQLVKVLYNKLLATLWDKKLKLWSNQLQYRKNTVGTYLIGIFHASFAEWGVMNLTMENFSCFFKWTFAVLVCNTCDLETNFGAWVDHWCFMVWKVKTQSNGSCKYIQSSRVLNNINRKHAISSCDNTLWGTWHQIYLWLLVAAYTLESWIHHLWNTIVFICWGVWLPLQHMYQFMIDFRNPDHTISMLIYISKHKRGTFPFAWGFQTVGTIWRYKEALLGVE